MTARPHVAAGRAPSRAQLDRRLTVSAFTISHYEGLYVEVAALSPRQIATELTTLLALIAAHPVQAALIEPLLERWRAYRAANGLQLH